MKTLHELTQTDEPAWQDVIEPLLAQAKQTYCCLPKNQSLAEQELLALQMTTRSTLGAVVWETGGLLVHDGWLRLLGSGTDDFSGVVAFYTQYYLANAGFLVVAHDVVGGVFAINTGGLDGNTGTIHYFAPDSLAWEDLGVGYTDFFNWALTGDITQFYANFYWDGWQNEVANLLPEQAFFTMPPLWSEQGKNMAQNTRKIVPLAEILNLIGFTDFQAA